MDTPEIEVALIGGLPSVRLNDPDSESAMMALTALMEAFGPDAVVDGDHESLAFDAERVSLAEIEAVLASLEN